MSASKRLLGYSLIASAAMAVMAGCNSNSGKDQTATGNAPAAANAPAGGTGSGERIVVVNNSTSPFWVAVEHGMTAAGKELNVTAELIRNNGTAAGQIERLEQVSAQSDVKGVGISVLDAKAKGIADKLTDLRKKNIPVVTIDSDGPKDARLAYIGANNIKAGEQAGQAAAALLPGGGKVVAFVGTLSAANARERLEGFKKGAGPKFEVVDTMEDNTDTTKARTNVTAAIQSHPDAKVLLGLWSYNAPAIAEEVTRANKRSQFTIVTFDAEPNTVSALQKGQIDATIIQQPYEYGYQAVKLLHAYIGKDDATIKKMVPADGIVNVPCRTVVGNPKAHLKGENVISIDDLKKYLVEKDLKGT